MGQNYKLKVYIKKRNYSIKGGLNMYSTIKRDDNVAYNVN
jgi:hypothetical protein